MLQHYLLQVDPHRMIFNPLNPRKHRGPEYASLKESIEQVGIIQPPIVRALPGDLYEVVDGEGRISVALELGLEKIWVICVGIVDDVEALMLLQTSNAVRSYDFLAESKGFARLSQQGVSTADLMKKFGYGETKIRTMVSIGSFPSDILALIEADIAKSEKQAQIWSPTLLVMMLPLREVAQSEKPEEEDTSAESGYDYSEIKKAVELVISGEITDGEKMHVYVVKRRYEIFQSRFDQELQKKLEEKLARAREELETAKKQEVLSLEEQGEQRVKSVQGEYQGQIIILQAQINHLQKQRDQSVKDVARSRDAVKAQEQKIAKELEEMQGIVEKAQVERQKYEKLRTQLQEEANQERLKRQQEAQLRQKKWEEEQEKEFERKTQEKREEHDRKLKELEEKLKGEYEQKKQKVQIKAENTVRGLLSHGKKKLSEAQQAIDHIVSPSMINGVRQQGSAQIESLLSALRSMRETLDQAERKLSYRDVIYVEGEMVNGHKQPAGESLS